jgi:hypothetical protein
VYEGAQSSVRTHRLLRPVNLHPSDFITAYSLTSAHPPLRAVCLPRPRQLRKPCHYPQLPTCQHSASALPRSRGRVRTFPSTGKTGPFKCGRRRGTMITSRSQIVFDTSFVLQQILPFYRFSHIAPVNITYRKPSHCKDLLRTILYLEISPQALR